MDVDCVITDPLVSWLAPKGCVLLVDCRSNAFEIVPLDDDNVVSSCPIMG